MYVYCFSLNHIWVTIYCASKFVFCFKKRKCKPVAACSLGRKGQSGGRTFEKEKSEKLKCEVEKIERIYTLTYPGELVFGGLGGGREGLLACGLG